MKKIFLLLFWAAAQTVAAQYQFQPPAAAGMGNATVAQTGMVGLYGNPAGLSSLENWGAMAFAERRFLLSELQIVSAGAALPTRSGNFGLVVQRFGFSAFHQQKLGLAYARKLGSGLAVGVLLDYFQTRIEEFGSRNTFTFEAGCQAAITPKLSIGAYVFSPAQVELADGENLPTIMRMGLAYRSSSKALLAVEVEKDIAHDYRIKGGFDYQLVDNVHLRAGFQTSPATFHFGFGYRIGQQFQADAAMSSHTNLGFSPSAGVTYSNEDK